MGDVVTAGIVFLQMIEKQLLLQRRFVVSFNAAADAAAAAAPPLEACHANARRFLVRGSLFRLKRTQKKLEYCTVSVPMTRAAAPYRPEWNLTTGNRLCCGP